MYVSAGVLTINPISLTVFLTILFLTCAPAVFAESSTRLVLLGTGTPQPDPDRSGSAAAVVVNGRAYLVDFGPGVIRRAAAAKLDKGVTELDPVNITTVFLTHLHSDHTAGCSAKNKKSSKTEIVGCHVKQFGGKPAKEDGVRWQEKEKWQE